METLTKPTVEDLRLLVEGINESLEKSVQEDKSRRFRLLFRRWASSEEVPYMTLRGHGYVVNTEDDRDLLIFETDGKVTMTNYEPVIEEDEEEDE